MKVQKRLLSPKMQHGVDEMELSEPAPVMPLIITVERSRRTELTLRAVF